MGRSRRLIEKHANLYREFCGPDHAFMMDKVRLLAEAYPVKKLNRQGGIHVLEAKKGVNNRYAPLLARDIFSVQTAHLKTGFELAPVSRLAAATVSLTDAAMRDWEEALGTKRLKPGELLLEQDG